MYVTLTYMYRMIPKSQCKVLILAAGIGSRLLPLTSTRPKCLVTLKGKPILYYQLTALMRAGLDDVMIVVGYRGYMIKEYVANEFPSLKVTFIENTDYAKTNKLHSWYLAKNFASSEKCIALDSDIVFHPHIIEMARDETDLSGAALYVGEITGGSDTLVVADVGGGGTAIGKDIIRDAATGTFTGIYVFSPGYSEVFFKKAGKIIQSGRENLFGYDVVNAIRRERGWSLRAVNVGSVPFAEIDHVHEVIGAEQKMSPH